MMKFLVGSCEQCPMLSTVLRSSAVTIGTSRRPWSAESRTENFISTGHLVAEILNVKVREINNFANNFPFYCQYGS